MIKAKMPENRKKQQPFFYILITDN